MDSLGVFHDVKVKNSSDLMEAFDQAFNQTNSLFNKMESFGNTKKSNFHPPMDNYQSEEDKELRNLYNYRNNNAKNTKRNFNFKKKKQPLFKPPMFPKIENSEYNYQKEYEKELIQEIEQLFNPSIKNRAQDGSEQGMLSFLSPIINSLSKNVSEKNKKFYEGGVLNNNSNKNNNNIIRNNMSKKSSIRSYKTNNSNLSSNKNISQEPNKLNDDDDDLESFSELKNFYNNETKGSNKSKSIRSIRRTSTNSKGKIFDINNSNRKNANSNSVFNRTLNRNGFGNKTKYTNYSNGMKRNNITQYELGELRKNRYFNRTNTNFKIIAKDKGPKRDEGKIDQLISQLKHHYG